MTVADQIVELLAGLQGAALTQKQIAVGLFGEGAKQSRVSKPCRSLVEEGLLRQMGRGGNGDPFTYRFQGVKKRA
ncbi:MAG: hypothetical protein Q8L23_00905 [Caulobacter sp.]|nr:hypothetical protein [Caulobacter sp.]